MLKIDDLVEVFFEDKGWVMAEPSGQWTGSSTTPEGGTLHHYKHPDFPMDQALIANVYTSHKDPNLLEVDLMKMDVLYFEDFTSTRQYGMGRREFNLTKSDSLDELSAFLENAVCINLPWHKRWWRKLSSLWTDR